MNKLTGEDYMTRDYLELSSHPDFSLDAYEFIEKIRSMKNEELDIIYLKHNGKVN